MVSHSGPGSVPGPGQASVKRSNTMVAAPASLSAAQLLAPGAPSADMPGMRRSHNTGYYSFRDYSPVYGTATLGRAAAFLCLSDDRGPSGGAAWRNAG